MSEEQQESPAAENLQAGQSTPYAAPQPVDDRTPRVPKKMMILTAIVLSLVSAAFVFVSELDDLFGLGLDIIMVASMFITALMILGWVGWFLMLSRWKWWQRIGASAVVVSLPFAFLTIFRPVNGGDANIARFEPIWTSRPKSPSADVNIDSVQVDLATKTSNDYPRFLGSQQNATAAIPNRFDEQKFGDARQLWRQPIGKGWSGFSARNGYAVTMEQRGEQECVTCYDIDSGALQWIYQYGARHQDKMNLGRVGPRSTPTIDDGKVYAVGAVGNFVCLNGADGEVIWQIDLNKMLGVEIATEPDANGVMFQYELNSALNWGRAGSPLIVGDLVVIPGGGPMGGDIKTLLAFDRQTGEQRWTGGTEMIAYGSPMLATVAGVEQILMIAETKAMGFDPESGEVLWTFARPGETNGGANTAQVTVVSDNQVLTSKGYPDGGGELIELKKAGDSLVPRSVWSNTLVLKTKLMSPVVYQGHSFALSNGFLECTRLSDGKRLWKRRGRFGHGQMLLVDDQILLHSEMGTLYLIAADMDGYREFGSLPTISGVCWNTLCLYGDKILLRSELEAACFQLPFK